MSGSTRSRVAMATIAAIAALGVTTAAASAGPIPGHYIVTVEKGHDPGGVARGAGARPRFVYSAALNGFAAELNQGQLNALRRNPHVTAVEQDQTVTADAVQNTDAAGDPWGLDRIDQRALPLSATYGFGSGRGAGVRAYVLDSGLQANHPDFGTRALNMFDAFGGSGADCNGHGTHVAGTIGGTQFGVAKAVFVRGVRVLDCTGAGPVSGVIAGVDWVRANHIKPAVANLSLGAGKSNTLNDAVTNLINAGVFVAVSAGNNGSDACDASPASTPKAYTVAASNRDDRRRASSNHGACVDGYAPGGSIKSDWIGGATAYSSGTSMASPHVAGTAALLKSYSSYANESPQFITDWLNQWATTGVILGNIAPTPNRLLWKAGL